MCFTRVDERDIARACDVLPTSVREMQRALDGQSNGILLVEMRTVAVPPVTRSGKFDAAAIQVSATSFDRADWLSRIAAPADSATLFKTPFIPDN